MAKSVAQAIRAVTPSSLRTTAVLTAVAALSLSACAGNGDESSPPAADTGPSANTSAGSDPTNGELGSFEGEFAVSAENVRVDTLTGDFADGLLVAQGTSGSCQSTHDFVTQPVLCLGFDLEYEATYQAEFGEAKESGAIQLEDARPSESVSCGASECTVGDARLVATDSGFELVVPEPYLDENDRAQALGPCAQSMPDGERREAITVIEQDANSIRSFSYTAAVGAAHTRGEECAGTYLIIYDRVLTRVS